MQPHRHARKPHFVSKLTIEIFLYKRQHYIYYANE